MIIYGKGRQPKKAKPLQTEQQLQTEQLGTVNLGAG